MLRSVYDDVNAKMAAALMDWTEENFKRHATDVAKRELGEIYEKMKSPDERKRIYKEREAQIKARHLTYLFHTTAGDRNQEDALQQLYVDLPPFAQIRQRLNRSAHEWDVASLQNHYSRLTGKAKRSYKILFKCLFNKDPVD